METFCLVLTDRLVDDDAATRARLAAAFDMDAATFQAKVWQRTPLIIRRGLDAESARIQVARLASLGAAGDALADETDLLWLRRADRTLGPLPASSLDRYARPGDRWCREGEGLWHDANPPASPPPLPGHGTAVPPPLPAPRGVRRRGRMLAWLGAAAALVLLVALWSHHSRPMPKTSDAVAYVPRPLQPLHPVASAAACHAADAAPTSEEDRFLVTGGERTLTGRSQRNGPTYVAEATSHHGAACDDTTVQLYLFRDGGFVGPATPAALEAGDRFDAFDLPDPDHLRYVVAHGPAKVAVATTSLTRQAQGWVARMQTAAPASASQP